MTMKLKQALIDYKKCETKEEKDNVMYQVFDYETIIEKNGNNKRNRIYRMKFKIESMQKARNYVMNYFHYVEGKDLEEYILTSVFKIFDSINVDLTTTDREVEVWFTKTLRGQVHNEVIEENEVNENIVSNEVQNSDDEEVISIYDDVAYKSYNDPKVQHSFDDFINSIGGYKKILSEKQYEVYTYIMSGWTQEKIAEKLGVTQQNVNKLLKSSKNNIAKQYIDYRFIHIAKNSQNTTKTIEHYLDTYINLIKYDLTNSCDYFGYTYNFLKEQFNQYSIDDKSYTVFDVIFDGLKISEHDLFNFVEVSFANPKVKFTSREKDKVVRAVNRIFEKYITNMYRAAREISHTVIDNYKSTKANIDEYDYFINNIS